jgi:hypothetical protein
MAQSQGGPAVSDHIPDATKMISDSPRMEAALFNAPDAGFANIWKVGCEIERELNTAQERIKRLEEDLMDAKNKHAALVADVTLYEDRGERIKRLEEAEDVIKASLQRSLNSNEQGECKWLAELPMTDAEFAVFTTAFKAKEAKP